MCAGVAGISSFHAAVGGTSLLILPMLFIQSFKRLSWLSMVGFISTMVVTATMLMLVALDPLRKHMPSQVIASAYAVAIDTSETLCSCFVIFLLPT